MPISIPSHRGFGRKVGNTGGGGGGPASTTNGVFNKTPYGYAARDAADVGGVSWSSDWAVEIAVRIPYGGFTGYLGEIFRWGQDACTFDATRPGVCLTFGNTQGYQLCGGATLTFSFTDGYGNAINVYPTSGISGLQHFVFTLDASTKSVYQYRNGAAAGYVANLSMLLPSTIAQPFVLGGMNLTPCSTTPSGESVFVNSKVAVPELQFYVVRIWQKLLSGADVSALYSHWSGTGRLTIPGGVTGLPVTGYDFASEVGNKSGTAGAGWIKDIYGGNHLKMVSTNSVTGATGPDPSLLVPTAGSVSIANVSDGSTLVPGGTVFRANGLSGTGNYQQFRMQFDTVNTFDSGNLRDSDWLLADGFYRPNLTPGAVWFGRVKGRNGDNVGVETAWSSTITFGTRNAQTWHARPLTLAGGAYGTEDGTSRANAFNGLRFQGHQGGRTAKGLQGEGDARKLSPGDTLRLQDRIGPVDQSTAGAADTGKPYYYWFVGEGLAAYPITLEMDDATYPASFYNFRRPTHVWGWVDQGGGVYSTTQTIDSSIKGIAFDETGSGAPNVGNPIQETVYSKQASGPLTGAGWYQSGGTTYVRRADGAYPANTLHLLGGPMAIAPVGRYVKFKGGQFYGMGVDHNFSTDVTLSAPLIKYSPTTPIRFRKFVDRWIVEDADISRAPNGIYGTNEGEGNCGNDITIRRCWIHHIGMGAFVDPDSHAIGMQSGLNWIADDNLLELCGTAIEFWTSTNAGYLKARRNLIIRPTIRSTTQGFGISFSNGSATAGLRLGSELLHNVVYESDGTGFHISTGDQMDQNYNMSIRPGRNAPGGVGYQQCWHGGSCPSDRPQNFNMGYNVFVDPPNRFIWGGGDGTGTAVFTGNRYWATGGVTASTGGKFSMPGVSGGGTLSFNGWQAAGPDVGAVFGDPLLAVPTGFDSLMAKTFCRSVFLDVTGTGVVDSGDLTAFDAEPAGDGARIAARKRLVNALTYGAY